MASTSLELGLTTACSHIPSESLSEVLTQVVELTLWSLSFGEPWDEQNQDEAVIHLIRCYYTPMFPSLI